MEDSVIIRPRRKAVDLKVSLCNSELLRKIKTLYLAVIQNESDSPTLRQLGKEMVTLAK